MDSCGLSCNLLLDCTVGRGDSSQLFDPVSLGSKFFRIPEADVLGNRKFLRAMRAGHHHRLRNDSLLRHIEAEAGESFGKGLQVGRPD